MTPLYNHNSAETAFLVPSYPYGRDRCRIRFWLESNPKKGFRFCSQTEHPRKLIWNAPKKSTYALLGGCMFLDAFGHCKWAALSEYSKAGDVLQFITNFPQADLISVRGWVAMKIAHLTRTISGEQYFTIGGVRQPYTDADAERDTAELRVWIQCKEKLLA